jgi:hypothetical protein
MTTTRIEFDDQNNLMEVNEDAVDLVQQHLFNVVLPNEAPEGEDFTQLQRDHFLTAAVNTLVQHWPQQDDRSAAAIGLVEGLKAMGWSRDEVWKVLKTLNALSGDYRPQDRYDELNRIYSNQGHRKKDRLRQPWSSLKRMLGAAKVRQVQGWFDLSQTFTCTSTTSAT